MATETDTAVKQRAAAAGVPVTLGMATVLIDFVPVSIPNKDKAVEFHRLCTKCETPHRVTQSYTCEEGHGPYTLGELTRKGKDIDGTLVEVTAEEVAAVRDVDPEGPTIEPQLALTVVPAADLDEYTLPGDIAYRLRPGKKGANGYAVLHHAVATALASGRALVGEATFREKEQLYRITIWRGQLLAQAIRRPDDLAEGDMLPTVELSEKLKTMVADAVDSLATGFDPYMWRNKARERALDLIEQKKADPGATITTIIAQPKASPLADLESLVNLLAS